MKTTTLYYNDGLRSDKVYTASIDAAGVVQLSWGRRGSTMQTKTVGPLPAAEALALYESKLAEKRAKGYEPGPDATPIGTVGFTPAARPVLVPKPMLLNEISDAELLTMAADPAYWMQEKHDGCRILLVKTGATLTSYSRSGRETSTLPKPIIDAAMDSPWQDFVLDGEIVGDVIWAFDVLRVTTNMRECPYEGRYTLLREIFGQSQSGIRVVETATTPDGKLALFARVRSEGGEGVVLKLASAKYEAGRPGRGGPALKYKFVKTASVIVISHNVQSSFNMKLHDGTDLGRCTIPPNKTAPAVGLVVEVRYLNVQRGGHLYQPVYLGVRDDIAPEECVVDQLKFKGEGDDPKDAA